MTLSSALKTAVAALIVAVLTVMSAHAQVRDTEIEEMLGDFTDPIVQAAGLSTASVDLYIINDPSLNAFVTRGQKIFLHTGLIMEAETPNQLKGVIAHEAGHIADGRIARSDYQNRSATGAMLLAAGVGLAAILAGEGGAGAAILGGAPQFGALEVLAHTRVGESVADQYAAQYLERTGQSGEGLIAFFEKFRYQEVLSQARRYPYFRSHPLSSQRIDQLRERVDESEYRDALDSEEDLFRFEMAKAKLSGFLDAPQVVFSKYPTTDTSQIGRYARSVAYFRTADMTLALREVDSLIAEVPDNPYFHELRAQFLYESGRAEESIPSIQRAIELKPDAPMLKIALAQALLERNAESDADMAVDLLEASLREERDSGTAWYYLSRAYGQMGQQPMAEYATAEQAFHMGDFNRAQAFAKRAQDDLPRNEPAWRRAGDIVAVSELKLIDSKDRRRRGLTFTTNTNP